MGSLQTVALINSRLNIPGLESNPQENIFLLIISEVRRAALMDVLGYAITPRASAQGSSP